MVGPRLFLQLLSLHHTVFSLACNFVQTFYGISMYNREYLANLFDGGSDARYFLFLILELSSSDLFLMNTLN